MHIQLGVQDDNGSLEGKEEHDAYNDPIIEEGQNPEDDLKSAIESMTKKKPRVRAQTAITRSRKQVPIASKYKIES